MNLDIEVAPLNAVIERLHNNCLSLILATTNASHTPNASYAPFAYQDGKFYILVSGLAIHGENLKAQGELDILLLEDESKTRNIYARLRVNYRATAMAVDKDSDEYATAIALLTARAGKTVSVLEGLADFTLYRLTPTRGTLVQGFGKAFVFDPADLTAGVIALNEKNIDQHR